MQHLQNQQPGIQLVKAKDYRWHNNLASETASAWLSLSGSERLMFEQIRRQKNKWYES